MPKLNKVVHDKKPSRNNPWKAFYHVLEKEYYQTIPTSYMEGRNKSAGIYHTDRVC